MGIFDSLTSIFTGQPVIDAAQQSRDYLAQQAAITAAQIQAAQKSGTEALTTGQTQGLGAVSGGIGTARSDISGGLAPSLASLYGGVDAASNALYGGQYGGLGALGNAVGSAASAYSPLYGAGNYYLGTGGAATDLSGDALGLNGPAGFARAVGAFQSSPGYDFAVSQGLNAINRGANAAGGGNFYGGNVARAAQTFGQGLANQDYQTWLNNIINRGTQYGTLGVNAITPAASGTANALLTGGTGAANIYTGTGGRLSDLYSGAGTAGAGLYTGAAKDLASLAAQGGLASAGIDTGTAAKIADLISGLTKTQVGYTQSQLDDYTKTYMDAAKAEIGGSQNLWNLIGGGAQLAASGGFLPSGGFTPWKLPSLASK